VHLDVSSADISMPVLPVAVDGKGDMAIPDSVGDVGWYEFGARPGDSSGTAVLAAHVDSFKDGLGPFARLRGIRKGAKITVTMQPGGSLRYKVTDVALVDKSTVPLADVFQRGGAPRLILITCGGAYSRGSGYSGNVIVTALPAPSH
jgi:LPXTG-site transpeptidase (sortase) family protein